MRFAFGFGFGNQIFHIQQISASANPSHRTSLICIVFSKPGMLRVSHITPRTCTWIVQNKEEIFRPPSPLRGMCIINLIFCSSLPPLVSCDRRRTRMGSSFLSQEVYFDNIDRKRKQFYKKWRDQSVCIRQPLPSRDHASLHLTAEFITYLHVVASLCTTPCQALSGQFLFAIAKKGNLQHTLPG